MSVVNPDETRADLPTDRTPFVHQLLEGWVDGHGGRRRQLAVVVLRENGWTFEEIGQVLNMHRGHACRLYDRCLQQLRAHFRQQHPGQGQPSGGFSDPAGSAAARADR